MKKDRASAEGEETWSRTAHGSRSMENTNWSPHTYTTRNENIPASFGLLSAIKRIPPVQPRINRVPGPRQTQIRFTSSLYADKFIETTSYRKSRFTRGSRMPPPYTLHSPHTNPWFWTKNFPPVAEKFVLNISRECVVTGELFHAGFSSSPICRLYFPDPKPKIFPENFICSCS